MGGDLVPARRDIRGEFEARADDMRQNDGGGPKTVGVDGRGEAASEIEEALELALRMVEAPRAGPAIGSAEDGGIAVNRADALDLPGDERRRLVPADADELITATVSAAPLRIFSRCEPALAHHRVEDARRVVLEIEISRPDRRRLRVEPETLQGSLSGTVADDLIGAEMRPEQVQGPSSY